MAALPPLMVPSLTSRAVFGETLPTMRTPSLADSASQIRSACAVATGDHNLVPDSQWFAVRPVRRQVSQSSRHPFEPSHLSTFQQSWDDPLVHAQQVGHCLEFCAFPAPVHISVLHRRLSQCQNEGLICCGDPRRRRAVAPQRRPGRVPPASSAVTSPSSRIWADSQRIARAPAGAPSSSASMSENLPTSSTRAVPGLAVGLETPPS